MMVFICPVKQRLSSSWWLRDLVEKRNKTNKNLWSRQVINVEELSNDPELSHYLQKCEMERQYVKVLGTKLGTQTPCRKGFVNKLMFLEYFLHIWRIIPNVFYCLHSSFSFGQTCFCRKKDLSECNNHTLVNHNRAGTVSLFWVFGTVSRNNTNMLPRTGLYYC